MFEILRHLPYFFLLFDEKYFMGTQYLNKALLKSAKRISFCEKNKKLKSTKSISFCGKNKKNNIFG